MLIGRVVTPGLVLFAVPMAQGNQDRFVVRVALLESAVFVQSINPPLGNNRVELLLLKCLPLGERSTSAHIAGVSHQDNFSLCPRHAQALGVSHVVLELVKRLLLLRALAAGSTLLDEVRQDCACVAEILVVAAVGIASPNEAAYIMNRKVCSGCNTVSVPLLLLAAGVGFPAACFLTMKMF